VKIHFERTGGFTALRLQATVDSAELSGPEVEHVRSLVGRARFFELPAALEAPGPSADRFQYRLTVESAGRSHTVRVGEMAVPNDLRPLVDWLTAAARGRR
jgi:hypothetical protein